MVQRSFSSWRAPRRRFAVLAICAMAAGCTNDAARIAPAVPTDLAGTAPPGLGTPRPVPIVSTYDGAYEGTLAPDLGNLPTCGAAPYGLARTMLVTNGHATLGVNLPFEGNVAPDGHIVMRYLNVGWINGRFAHDAFAGVLRAGNAGACRWAVGLAKMVPERPPPPAERSLAPGLVPMGKAPGAAGLPADPFTQRPPTGACAPASLENCR